MPLHERVVAALQASQRLSDVSKAAYVRRLRTLQQLVGRGLKALLLKPKQTLHTLHTHRCSGTHARMSANTEKSYIALVLAALKHTPELRKLRRYRRARRKWVHAFKHVQVEHHGTTCVQQGG